MVCDIIFVISDIDFERKTIHIRQSKYKKDRIVPLSVYMARGLKRYLSVEYPHIWLFNGKEVDGRYSVRGLSWVMREALKKTGIKKKVNLHTWGQNLSLHPPGGHQQPPYYASGCAPMSHLQNGSTGPGSYCTTYPFTTTGFGTTGNKLMLS